MAPLPRAFLIEEHDWRGTLWLLATTVSIGFILFWLLLVRDLPESCGLEPYRAKQPSVSTAVNLMAS